MTAIGLAPAANAQEKPSPSYEQFRAISGQIAAKYLGDRLDYRKYGEEMRALGARDLRISNPALGIKYASPETAHAAYQGYMRERAGLPEGSSMVPLAVPVDAFTAQTVAFVFSVSGGGWVDHIELHWNFRDNYVNGSAPDDAAGIALDDFDFGCYSGVYTWKESYTWDGVRTSDAYVWEENLTPDTAVFRLRDRVSGFVLNVDHGFVATTLHRTGSPLPSCGNPLQRITGSGWYEHNQDGNGSWTVGIGWGFFDLEYTGNPGSTLQKAGGVDTIR